MCITAAALQALGMGAASASTAATVGSIAMGGATDVKRRLPRYSRQTRQRIRPNTTDKSSSLNDWQVSRRKSLTWQHTTAPLKEAWADREPAWHYQAFK